MQKFDPDFSKVQKIDPDFSKVQKIDPDFSKVQKIKKMSNKRDYCDTLESYFSEDSDYSPDSEVPSSYDEEISDLTGGEEIVSSDDGFSITDEVIDSIHRHKKRKINHVAFSLIFNLDNNTDIVGIILKFLTLSELLKMTQLNHVFYSFINDSQYIWKQKFQMYYGDEPDYKKLCRLIPYKECSNCPSMYIASNDDKETCTTCHSCRLICMNYKSKKHKIPFYIKNRGLICNTRELWHQYKSRKANLYDEFTLEYIKCEFCDNILCRNCIATCDDYKCYDAPYRNALRQKYKKNKKRAKQYCVNLFSSKCTCNGGNKFAKHTGKYPYLI